MHVLSSLGYFNLPLSRSPTLANLCLYIIQESTSLEENIKTHIFTWMPFQFMRCPIQDVLSTVPRCFLEAELCLLTWLTAVKLFKSQGVFAQSSFLDLGIQEGFALVLH